jgi:tripeptide aminopeptidase
VSAADLVADVLEIAAIPAPTFDEEARLTWLEERLRGVPGERSRDAAGNLVWSWGQKPPELLLLVHVDTVFDREADLSFRREHARLVGPGIGDNAAAIGVTLHAVTRLLRGQRPRAAAVAFTVGEEGLGNLRGAVVACESLRPAAAVAVEGHGLERVIVDAVGSVRVRVRVEGPGGHSWVDRGRPSAIHELFRLAEELRRHDSLETPVNIGVVSGGQSVNTIAPDAEFIAEMRALAEEPLSAFASAAGSLAAAEPLRVTVEEVGRRPAGRLDRSSHLLTAVRSVRRELGLADALGSGSTDANAALARGIPALTLGCTYGARMHTRAEWIDAGALDLGRRQLTSVLALLLAA